MPDSPIMCEENQLIKKINLFHWLDCAQKSFMNYL